MFHHRPHWDVDADPDAELHPDVKECYARADAAIREVDPTLEKRDKHLFLATYSYLIESAVYDDDTETSFSFPMSVKEARKRARHDIRIGNSIMWSDDGPVVAEPTGLTAGPRIGRPSARPRSSRARRTIRTSRGSPGRPRREDDDPDPVDDGRRRERR